MNDAPHNPALRTRLEGQRGDASAAPVVQQAKNPRNSAAAGAAGVLVPNVVLVMMTVVMMVDRGRKRRIGAEKQGAERKNDCRERLIHESTLCGEEMQKRIIAPLCLNCATCNRLAG